MKTTESVLARCEICKEKFWLLEGEPCPRCSKVPIPCAKETYKQSLFTVREALQKLQVYNKMPANVLLYRAISERNLPGEKNITNDFLPELEDLIVCWWKRHSIECEGVSITNALRELNTILNP